MRKHTRAGWGGGEAMKENKAEGKERERREDLCLIGRHLSRELRK